LLTPHVTPADQQDREQVAELAQTAQEVAGGTVDVAFVEQGHFILQLAEAFAEGIAPFTESSFIAPGQQVAVYAGILQTLDQAGKGRVNGNLTNACGCL